MKNVHDAYAYADRFGFRYKRCRIGVSIYRDRENLQVLEISHSWAALYDAQPPRMPKKERLVRIWRFEAAKQS